MAKVLPSVTQVQVENFTFLPTARPTGSTKTLFLGGAGVRGLQIEGTFVKFTAIGVYLEDNAISELAIKWKGKSAEELTISNNFFRDIITGPFEKFYQVTFIRELMGQEFVRKVSENCVAYLKSVGSYTDVEAKAVESLRQVFNDEIFPPGSSVFYTQSPLGTLTIAFSKDESIPEIVNSVIENKPLSETVLETIIGNNGVSPAARRSLAARLSELLKEK